MRNDAQALDSWFDEDEEVRVELEAVERAESVSETGPPVQFYRPSTDVAWKQVVLVDSPPGGRRAVLPVSCHGSQGRGS